MQDLSPSEVDAILKSVGQSSGSASTQDKLESSATPKISRMQLGQLQEVESSNNPVNLKQGLQGVKLQVDIVLGRTRMSLQELLDLKEGQLLSLDKLAGEPLEIEINGRLIAYGEVVAIDDYYGVHITQIL